MGRRVDVRLVLAATTVLLLVAALWAVTRPAPAASAPPQQDLSRFHANKPLGAQKRAGLVPAQTDSLYTPVAPCRIAATATKGGPLKGNAARTFKVGGAAGYSAQGGRRKGCGIPAAATGVTVNVTAISPTKAGYLRLWAKGGSEPNTRFLSYSKHATTTAGGASPLGGGSTADLRVANHGGKVNVEVDVTGYYQPQMHGLVSPASTTDPTHNAPIYAGSSRIVSATNPSPGIYVVTFDSNITYCSPMVDTYNASAGIYGAAYAFSGKTATVFTWYLSSTTHTETPYSYYFYIDVVC